VHPKHSKSGEAAGIEQTGGANTIRRKHVPYDVNENKLGRPW
jgi:hypothetical protein